MIFFDTNVLVYMIIDQDKKKQFISEKLIIKALENDSMIISPLVISELIFILSKLNLSENNILKALKPFYNNSNIYSQDIKMTNEAFELCLKLKTCKNINDAIHLKFAEKYCDKLITFDSDFKKFIPHTNLEIEIL